MAILLLTGIESVAIARDQLPHMRLMFVACPITRSLITETLLGYSAVLFWWRTNLRGAIICGLLVPSHAEPLDIPRSFDCRLGELFLWLAAERHPRSGIFRANFVGLCSPGRSGSTGTGASKDELDLT